MWEEISALGSAYPDTFDYSIYDQLYERFDGSAPREGVVYKTTFRLVNFHSSCSKCHYAFELDTYGRGCIHDCIYCYANQQLTAHGAWNRPIPFPVDLAEIRKIFFTVFETSKKSKWRSILERRIPLRLGAMSDPFMWLDKKYRVTYELLKLLRFYKYPYLIFTRSDLVADDAYIDVMDSSLAGVQISISGGDEKLTKILEPGAPSVERRLAALRKLKSVGFWTTVRLNPFFPIYPDGYFTDEPSIRQRFGGRKNAPKFDLFDWEFLDRIAEQEVPSVLAGFVRLSPWALNNLKKSLGFDFSIFFKPDVLQGRGDRHYSDSEIAFYYTKLRSECESRGLRFGTCYIGNGQKDYFQYQHLWSNLGDCCDARGNVQEFRSSSQDVGWNERSRFSAKKWMVETSMSEDLAWEKRVRELPFKTPSAPSNDELHV
jgi:DNA repair photolyase